MNKRQTCSKCARPQKLCYCHLIKNLKTESKQLILRHFKEKDHPFNTAKMAEMSLSDCTILDSDDPNFTNEISDFITKENPFLLFYTSESKELEESLNEIPSKNFIALDGTWDKAKKILFSNESLSKIPIFHLNPKSETIYRPIRKACAENFISTVEAIKEAIELIENRNDLEELLEPLRFTVQEQLKYQKKGPS
ncbi:DTW domain-containing protein [Bacteriovorax sp. DB6_IX]|uniref:DTW domain-containing protein n=1 Tax=Bacteriovorax sp. DB6_IX TaxID=1353530 RepID=UPI0005541DE0|nr:tRNA-uridine aminocarboxypropyltransferase [Bacteriovorax sp. DB6_IX]